MGCYLLVGYMDPNLDNNSVTSPSENNLPDWLWLICAVCTSLGHLFDGTDGKQARRTGASGPTGELCKWGAEGLSNLCSTLANNSQMFSWSWSRFVVYGAVYYYNFLNFWTRWIQVALECPWKRVYNNAAGLSRKAWLWAFWSFLRYSIRKSCKIRLKITFSSQNLGRAAFKCAKYRFPFRWHNNKLFLAFRLYVYWVY